MLFPQGAVYYAYFPYQENLTASVNPAGTSAEEFFEGLVSSWTLPADQSGDAFKASDLMIGSASVESEAVNMTLSHAMALAAVELPGKVYTFTNTDVQIPDYSLTADAEFDEIVPFKSSGLFLCLVKPGDFSLSGSIGGESWSFDGNAVAGAYMLHSEGEAEVIEHQLQIGDFFLADGSLLPKDAPASEVSAAHVLGVVCQYDPDRIGKGEKEALGGTAHALVLGSMLAGANGNPYVYMQYRFYTDYSIQDTDFDNSYVRDEEGEIGFPRVPQEKNITKLYELANVDLEGYKATHLIYTERAEDLAAGNVSESGGFEGTMTWFIEEGVASTAMNKSFEKIAANRKSLYFEGQNSTMVSTEAAPDCHRYIDLADLGWVDYLCYWKYTTSFVRPMLAF